MCRVDCTVGRESSRVAEHACVADWFLGNLRYNMGPGVVLHDDDHSDVVSSCRAHRGVSCVVSCARVASRRRTVAAPRHRVTDGYRTV